MGGKAVRWRERYGHWRGLSWGSVDRTGGSRFGLGFERTKSLVFFFLIFGVGSWVRSLTESFAVGNAFAYSKLLELFKKIVFLKYGIQ